MPSPGDRQPPPAGPPTYPSPPTPPLVYPPPASPTGAPQHYPASSVPAGPLRYPPGSPAAGSGRREGSRQSLLDKAGALPASRGDAGLWLVFAVLGFLAGQIVALIFTYVMAAITGHSAQLQRIADMSAPPLWYVASSLIGLWVGFLGGPWLASRVRGTGRLLADLGVRFRLIDLLGVVIGVGGQVVIAIMYAPFISHIKHFNAPTEKLTGSSHGSQFVVIAILTVVGAPFFEELFFRGLLFRALARLCTPLQVGPSTRRTIGLVVAVVVDGLLFGLAHGEWVQFAGLAFFGMVLAVVSYRTGRLGMNMVAHASFNLVAIIAVLQNGGTIFH